MATDKKNRVKWLVNIKASVDKSGLINKFYPPGVKSFIVYRFTDCQTHKVHTTLWIQFSTKRYSPLQELPEISHLTDVTGGESQAKLLAQTIRSQGGIADHRTNLVLKSVAGSTSRLTIGPVIEDNVFPTDANCLFFNTPIQPVFSPGNRASQCDAPIHNQPTLAVQNYIRSLETAAKKLDTPARQRQQAAQQMLFLHHKSSTLPSTTITRYPDNHRDQLQETSQTENSTDSQTKVSALQGQRRNINTMMEDQREQEERLEELQAQLQMTQDQV